MRENLKIHNYLPQVLQPGNGAIWAVVNVVNNADTKIVVNVLIFNILTLLATLNEMRIISEMLSTLNTRYLQTNSVFVNR